MNEKRITKLLALLVALLWILPASARTYVVSVGLGNYSDGENSLPCSLGDVKAISNFYKHYNNSDVFMLVDRNATRAHILKVLKEQFAKAGSSDEVIFCYSGHGFDGGVSCYDTENVVFCSEVQKIMRNCKAKRKIMFIMACHSGSFKNKYDNDPRRRFEQKSDVMIYLSSRANEYSWENSRMDKSYFYDALLRALRGKADKNGDRIITARELFNYVNRDVIDQTGGRQHPQMYGNFSDNMVIVDLNTVL